MVTLVSGSGSSSKRHSSGGMSGRSRTAAGSPSLRLAYLNASRISISPAVSGRLRRAAQVVAESRVGLRTIAERQRVSPPTRVGRDGALWRHPREDRSAVPSRVRTGFGAAMGNAVWCHPRCGGGEEPWRVQV